MIKTFHLTKRYSSTTAVDDLSLEIPEGEVFGFLGPNGAGKTTTIRMLSGTLKPSSGRIEICGLDLASDPVAVKRRIGVIPDRPFLYEKLTAREFLDFLGGLHSIPTTELSGRIVELLQFFELSDWTNELIEGFSHGMKQRLAICGALLHRPKVLIIDEPLVGLDPSGARRIKNLLVALGRNGTTIFLSTHSLDAAEEICGRVGVIHKGRMVAVGSVSDVKHEAGKDGGRLEEVFLTLVREQEESAITR